MGKINQNTDAAMNTLKPQPGQYNSYHPKFHPLPGEWAKQQLSGRSQYVERSGPSSHAPERTELQKALAAEEAQHRYWEQWQGVTPGKPVYEDPRQWQNTLLPTAKYGTEGRGYG